jgi:beta-phosphoglucomutase family hydrolase
MNGTGGVKERVTLNEQLEDIRGIIFDLDGTLADTMPAHYEAWQEILRQYSLEMSEDRFYALGGWPTKKVADLLIAESGRTIDSERLSHEKESLFEETLHLVEPIGPVTDVVREHHGRLKLAVATGATRPIAEQVLRQIGIRDCFEAIVCSEDVPRHKPEPDVFLEAARRIEIEPRYCVVYEDTNPGLEAARRAGMRHVDVRQFYTPRRVT